MSPLSSHISPLSLLTASSLLFVLQPRLHLLEMSYTASPALVALVRPLRNQFLTRPSSQPHFPARAPALAAAASIQTLGNHEGTRLLLPPRRFYDARNVFSRFAVACDTIRIFSHQAACVFYTFMSLHHLGRCVWPVSPFRSGSASLVSPVVLTLLMIYSPR